MMNLEEAREFFKGDIFAKETGITIDEVEDGRAVCSLILEDWHMNAAGNAMGGVLFTLADFTFAVAANSSSDTLVVTASSTISFMSPGKGKELTCEASRLKDGRKNCFYEMKITDEAGTLISVVSATGTHI